MLLREEELIPSLISGMLGLGVGRAKTVMSHMGAGLKRDQWAVVPGGQGGLSLLEKWAEGRLGLFPSQLLW